MGELGSRGEMERQNGVKEIVETIEGMREGSGKNTIER